MLHHHTHHCNDCGNETVYHTYDHESEGDTVEAWCDDCEADTDHTIGAWY